MTSSKKSVKSGFTILELALAMAFVSFLLLAIGFAMVQVSVVYQKGLTIKAVNSTGREIIDEFSRTILASKYNEDNAHFEYTFTEKTDKVEVNGDDKEVQLYGAFCTGTHSYIWNTGYALDLPDKPENENKKAVFIERKGGDGSADISHSQPSFRLARVSDTGREICIRHANRIGTSEENIFDSEKASNFVEILSPSENDLVFYNFTMFKPAYHGGTGHALFAGSFILGTSAGTIDITLPGNFCTDKPGNFATDFTYCSVNKFNFAARATGGLAI